MDDEFLKKFIGKHVSAYMVGYGDGFDLVVTDVSGGILRGLLFGQKPTFLECELIMGIISED